MNWSYALRNLLRNKHRTMATGIAIAAGFIGLVLLGGYIYRIERHLAAQAVYIFYHGHISVQKRESLEKYAANPVKYQITKEEIDQLKNILEPYKSNLAHTGFGLTGMGLISNGVKSIPFFANGVDVPTMNFALSHPSVLKWAYDLLTADALSYKEHVTKNPEAISITPLMAEIMNRPMPFDKLNPEEKSLQLAGMSVFNDLNAVNGDLVSSHTTGALLAEDTSLVAPLGLLQNLFQTENVQYVSLFLSDEAQLDRILKELNQKFEQSKINLIAHHFNHPEISPTYDGAMGFLYVMAGFFLFLICGAVVLSILNSLTMGIIERAKEIGTLRAIGFNEHQIAVSMTRENLGLVIISSTIGAGLAWIIATVVNQLNIRFYAIGAPNPVQFVIVPNIYVCVIAFLAFMTIVGFSSYFFIRSKLKTNIITLLSDTGA